MEKPLVSVIMPVYNTKQWVWEAIESILGQTLSNFEFIIVDDCSTDGSYEICQKYAQQDKRIRLYRNEKNEGVAYTKNKLIQFCTTDYLASQDSDDVSSEHRLYEEYTFLKNHPEYAVVWGNNSIIDENGNTIGHRTYRDDIEKVIFKWSPVSHPSTMMRKTFFEKVWWYSKIHYVEDYDLWIRFYNAWYKIKNLDQDLLQYRIRKWQTKSKYLKQVLKNTIQLQKHYRKQWVQMTFWDTLYFLGECLLYLLPSCIIFFFFKKITYKPL